MSALDVLAARRAAVQENIDRVTAALVENQKRLDRLNEVMGDLSRAADLLEGSGWVREWEDSELRKMVLVPHARP